MNKTTYRRILFFYWQKAYKYPKYIAMLLISIPLTALVSSYLPPLILATVFNKLASHNYQSHNVWASFGPSLIAYAVLVLFGGIVMWRIVDHFVWRLEGAVLNDLARQVFKHLLDQSADFHSNNFGGSLVSQNNKLLSSYIRIADTTWFQVYPMLWGLIFISVILSRRAPAFVVILIIFSAIYIISAFFVTRRVRDLSAKQAKAESRQTGYLADAITNVMAIKSFARSKFEIQRYKDATDTTHGWLTKLAKASQLQQSYFTFMTSSILALSLVIAVVGVVSFDANVATVFLILSYTASIASQLFQFSNQSLRNYNRALGDANEMVKVLDVSPEIQDTEHPEIVNIKSGTIEFRDVVFQHKGSESLLFNKINLSFESGEKIGLVGHSGSGKTTFTRVLLRFSDISSGSILIDGQNIANITQDDLHDSIAYVPQEPLLFHRSIEDNIAYGRPTASTKSILLAAQRAHASEFIDSLPKGYQTLVGERGVKLSGGQRQRIAIARAMLKDAPIIVLDEATSALDSDSEVLIQDALWKLMEGRTTIVIAHRLSTIQRMDRIIVLDNGRIAEQGTHNELLKLEGIYAKLWSHQSGGFIES